MSQAMNCLLVFRIFLTTTCILSILISGSESVRHEKKLRSHSLISSRNLNCKTIKFKTLKDGCDKYRSKHPVQGSCTKFIYCEKDPDTGELIPLEDECEDGAAFLAKWNACGMSSTPDICLQTECGAETHPSGARIVNRQYGRPNPKKPDPVYCDDQQEDQEDFGNCIPRNSPSVPNWGQTTKKPSNMNYPNGNGLPNYGNSNSGQSSSGYGNREAGRAEGQQQGSAYSYGNRGGQGQGQSQTNYGNNFYPWEPPKETTTRKPIVYNGEGQDQKPSGPREGYPAFPGYGHSTTYPPTTTKFAFPKDDEHKENQGGYNSNPNDPSKIPNDGQEQGEEEDPIFDLPTQQGQVQNGNDKNVVTTSTIFLLTISLYFFNNGIPFTG